MGDPTVEDRDSLRYGGVERTARFEDDGYCLAAFRTDGEDYVLLYVADEQSWFLGRDTQNVDLVPFWHKHLEDEAYCIPCELMLCFDEQWIRVPGESPLELGIGTARAQALIEKAMGKIPALGDLSIA